MGRSFQGLRGLRQETTRETLALFDPTAFDNYDRFGRSLDYIRQIRSDINCCSNFKSEMVLIDILLPRTFPGNQWGPPRMNEWWPIPRSGAKRILAPIVSTVISELNDRITPVNADVGFSVGVCPIFVWRPVRS